MLHEVLKENNSYSGGQVVKGVRAVERGGERDTGALIILFYFVVVVVEEHAFLPMPLSCNCVQCTPTNMQTQKRKRKRQRVVLMFFSLSSALLLSLCYFPLSSLCCLCSRIANAVKHNAYEGDAPTPRKINKSTQSHHM